MNAVLSDPESKTDIMQIKHGRFEAQLREVMDQLPKWREDRPHGPNAVLSVHDTSALTSGSASYCTSLLISSPHLAHHRAARRPCRSSFPLHHPLTVSGRRLSEADSRPAIFELRDLNDNEELQRAATRLLGMTTSITPSLDLIEPLMASLIDIMQKSTVSQNSGGRADNSHGEPESTPCPSCHLSTSEISRCSPRLVKRSAWT